MGLIILWHGLKHFSGSPSPFGINFVFELIGTWFWLIQEGLGLWLDNFFLSSSAPDLMMSVI